MRKLLMIVNPNAGKSQVKGNLTDILDAFVKEGYQIEIYITQKAGDATEMAARRGREADRLVCTGGDGTLDEVVNGLMRLPAEERPELGYVSAGTTNDYAHSLRIPANMVEAARTAAAGRAQSMDLGLAADREQGTEQYFTYVYGFGTFTNISYDTPQELKRVLGAQAYFVEGARELINMRAYPMRVEAGDQVLEGRFLCGLVSNSFQIGGMPGLWGKEIRMDDGLLEVTLLREPVNVVGWGDLAASFMTGSDASEHVLHFKTDHIRFLSPEPVDWVKDGEFGGSHREVEIRVLPGELNIVAPEEEAEAEG